jgi:hypothetical protein
MVPVGDASNQLLTHQYAAVSDEDTEQSENHNVESQDSHAQDVEEGGNDEGEVTNVSSLFCNPYADRDGNATVLTPSSEGRSTILADESVAYILRSLEFWLLWAAFFFLAGAALAWKNSLGALVQRMAAAGQLPPLNAASKPADVNAFVSSASSAWALVNACARIVGGFAIDATRRAVARRPLWMALSALLFGGGMAPLAYAASFGHGSAAPPSDLSVAFWAANLGNACSYGLAWAICATLLSLLFGTTSLSRNYGILLLSLAAGGFVFTQLGTDAETGGGTSGGGGGGSDGASVFAVSLWSAVGAAAAALVPSLWLAARYRVFISPSSGATGLPLNARSLMGQSDIVMNERTKSMEEAIALL